MTLRIYQVRSAAPVSAFGLSWLLAFVACAEDWPQWRGPNRDAVWNETNILQTFPTNGLKVRWRAPVGFGYSSPIVGQGRVVVSDSRLEIPKAHDRVLCFDEVTGKLLWSFSNRIKFPQWAFTPANEQGPNSTPIVLDGKVYAVGSLGYRLYCLDARNGRVFWQKDLQKEYRLTENANSAASPLIDSNLLVLLVGANESGACVFALDKNSGKLVWKALNETAAHSSPMIITSGGVRQLIVWTQQSVTSLNPATGRVYWREAFSGGDTGAVSTPVFADHRLLVGGLMLKLDADKPAAAVLWPEARAPSKRILSGTSTALLTDKHVFSAKSLGEFVCLEASTGKQLWTTNSVADQKSGATVHLTVNDNSVLLFNERGELIRAHLTAQGFHEISRVRLIEPAYPFGGRKVAWTAPAFANRHAFARTDKELVCASLEP